MNILEVTGLEAGYGDLTVLHGVEFSVARGELSVLLGPNGAGKSTTLGVLAGLIPKRRGTVTYEGSPLPGASARQCVQRGICLVPEGRRVFPDLSVELNLRVAEWASGRSEGRGATVIGEAYDLFPRLRERRRQLAGTLSGGEQQMLAIARALVARPKLLLVDECSMGLAPVIAKEVFALLRRLAESGIAVLAVEQNALVLDFATAAFVLEQGQIVHAARGRDIETVHEQAIRSYLGGEAQLA